MDHKEKYEQALERCKKEFNFNNLAYSHEEIKQRLERVFPELKESEDEKIRRGLIAKLSQDKELHHKAIAWLKKQGEQKPTDKVEPKFKVGDFIINEYGFIMQIDGIDGNMYVYHVLDDNRILKHDITKTEESCHLWTIQDAKDGDVLATDNGGICIFDGTVEEGIYPFAYCGLTRYGFEFYDRKLPFTHDNNVYPATKEQRDLLFQKMKEAGYEWDNEKKELKKIEQKPAWSEDDEEKIELLITIFKVNHPNEYFKANPINTLNMKAVSAEEIVDWLKSLKDKYTWKPSDEQIKGIKCAIKTLQHQLNVGDKRLDSLYDDLKKLREE